MATVSSLLPPSTTTRSSQKLKLSMQSAMLAASLPVIVIELSFGITEFLSNKLTSMHAFKQYGRTSQSGAPCQGCTGGSSSGRVGWYAQHLDYGVADY